MAEGFWEQAVETYLTIDRGVFLNPQYLVGEPGIWEAVPDFVAIDFSKDEIWMVEVTKAPRSSLFDKISRFEKDYVPRIRNQLEAHRLVRDPAQEWSLGLWIFAPNAAIPSIRERAERANLLSYRLTPLEDVIFPNWNDRFR